MPLQQSRVFHEKAKEKSVRCLLQFGRDGCTWGRFVVYIYSIWWIWCALNAFLLFLNCVHRGLKNNWTTTTILGGFIGGLCGLCHEGTQYILLEHGSRLEPGTPTKAWVDFVFVIGCGGVFVPRNVRGKWLTCNTHYLGAVALSWKMVGHQTVGSWGTCSRGSMEATKIPRLPKRKSVDSMLLPGRKLRAKHTSNICKEIHRFGQLQLTCWVRISSDCSCFHHSRWNRGSEKKKGSRWWVWFETKVHIVTMSFVFLCLQHKKLSFHKPVFNMFNDSFWKLGVKGGYGGSFVSFDFFTITKGTSFYYPVVCWGSRCKKTVRKTSGTASLVSSSTSRTTHGTCLDIASFWT